MKNFCTKATLESNSQTVALCTPPPPAITHIHTVPLISLYLRRVQHRHSGGGIVGLLAPAELVASLSRPAAQLLLGDVGVALVHQHGIVCGIVQGSAHLRIQKHTQQSTCFSDNTNWKYGSENLMRIAKESTQFIPLRAASMDQYRMTLRGAVCAVQTGLCTAASSRTGAILFSTQHHRAVLE